MGLFSKLFGGDRTPPRDIAELVAPLCRPGIRLAPASAPTGSWLGGRPVVPRGFEWPRRDERALGFLGQLDLAELARACALEWLPTAGSLAFFYDVVDSPWGYDLEHAGGWRVEHVAGEGQELAPPADIATEAVFARRPIEARRVSLPPEGLSPAVKALELSDRESDLLGEHVEALFEHGPDHHVGGFAYPVQFTEVELECQLASNGLYIGDEDPRVEALAPGASEWRLLLQLGSDPELGMEWGDCGSLYFCVRAAQARRGDFTVVWTVLQCT